MECMFQPTIGFSKNHLRPSHFLSKAHPLSSLLYSRFSASRLRRTHPHVRCAAPAGIQRNTSPCDTPPRTPLSVPLQ